MVTAHRKRSNRTRVWRGPGITLYSGDCLTVLAQIPDVSVDFIFTDPPGSAR